MKLEFTVKQEDREQVLDIIDRYKLLVKEIKKQTKKRSGIRFSVTNENVKTIGFKITQPDLVFFDYEILGVINPTMIKDDFAEVPCEGFIPVSVIDKFIKESIEQYKKTEDINKTIYTIVYDRKSKEFLCVSNMDTLIMKRDIGVNENTRYGVELLATLMILFERKIKEFSNKVEKI